MLADRTLTLAPGSSRTFPLACTPSQAGSYVAALTITSNAASETSTIALAPGQAPIEIPILGEGGLATQYKVALSR
jgi:hypothetical protein